MDKKTEALKLALEALNRNDYLGWQTNIHVRQAIREALAEQPAQQQTPVAYMGTDIEGTPNKFRLNPFGGCIPLYEKPQSVKVWDAEGYDALCQELEGWKAKASKPWVELTNEEIYTLFNKAFNGKQFDVKGMMTFAHAFGAKLREKNNG